MSTLKVNELQHTNGTSAATIDSSGNLLPSSTGSVLQVVAKQVESPDTAFEITSTSYTKVDDSISISITPKKSDSKILLSFTFHADSYGSNSSILYTIFRGSTDLTPSDKTGLGRVHDLGSRILITIPITAVDEPNTTNAVTYYLYAKRDSSSGVRVRQDITPTVITATEIAG